MVLLPVAESSNSYKPGAKELQSELECAAEDKDC